jgi:hypothetical protein
MELYNPSISYSGRVVYKARPHSTLISQHLWFDLGIHRIYQISSCQPYLIRSSSFTLLVLILSKLETSTYSLPYPCRHR